MADKWIEKDERQFQHISENMEQRGVRQERARQVAARTVNKQRRKEGRTPNRSTQGTGNPNAPLPERTKQELYNRARQLGIPGRSKMSKRDLVTAIRNESTG